MAKTGPAIASNPLSGPRRSLIKEARAVQQAEEKEKDDWVEELGIETPKGKVRDSIRPASSKTAVPPEIGKTNRIIFDEMYEDSQELRSLPKYKKQDKLLVMGLVGIIGVMMIMIAMTVLFPIISKSISRNEVIARNSESKKNPVFENNLLQGVDPKGDTSKIELPKEDRKSDQDEAAALKKKSEDNITKKQDENIKKKDKSVEESTIESNVAIAQNPIPKPPEFKSDITKDKCKVLFNNSVVIPLESFLANAIEDPVEIDRLEKEGVIVELPIGQNLLSDPKLYYTFCPEKTVRIDKINTEVGNRIRVILPKGLKKNNLQEVCLLFARGKSNDKSILVQFFEPLKIVLSPIDFPKARNVNPSPLTFKFGVEPSKSNVSKYKLFVNIQKNEYNRPLNKIQGVSVVTTYETENQLSYNISNPDLKRQIVDRIQRNVLIEPALLIALPKIFPDSMESFLKIGNYDFYIPVSFTETSDIERMANPSKKYHIKPGLYDNLSSIEVYNQAKKFIDEWQNDGSNDAKKEILYFAQS